ncbi:DUF4332 domain-containing protein [Halobacillus mangrovi]|uniref:DUF4332 domain-containing protein n=1 Tax=Halobacillus mangrovi TaxID=402384 RepID=UPI003D96B02F
MEKKNDCFPGDSDHDYEIRGVVRDAKTKRGLSGYHVTAIDMDKQDASDFLGKTVTRLNGEFLIAFDKEDFVQSKREQVNEEGRPDLVLTVVNRFGHEVKVTELKVDADPIVEMAIDVDIHPEQQRPQGPPIQNPFKVLRESYKEEIAILYKTGITTRDRLFEADLELIAEKGNISVQRLEAFRLHAELAYVKDFELGVARAFVAYAGVKTREEMTVAQPFQLMRAIKQAQKEKVIDPSREFSTSMVYGWIGAAKGFDPTLFANPFNIRSVLRDANLVSEAIKKYNPGIDIINVAGLLNPFNRLQAMGKVRALMETAGVHNLSELGTFEVKGTRVIHPGFYVARPFRNNLTRLASEGLIATLFSHGDHFKRIEAFPDAIRFVENPVTDAVIIGSLVDFVEDGRLVIGKEVTSLTIITEEIRYSDVNQIVYENHDIVPPTRPSISPQRAATGQPHNDRNVYAPGEGNRGRLGGRGADGLDGNTGINGDEQGAAPEVTIYVQRTPEGLPDINIGGRRGGRGQQGQHGGNGSDGARGREASSGACYCHREVGHGGHGGDGGKGGDGGGGGAGGTGGNLTIYTLDTNITRLTTERPYFVNMSGGAGGNGGSPGAAGEAGSGGAPGDDSWPWCEQEPSRVGRIGSRGSEGNYGEDGGKGNDGIFTLQPLSLSDWNAVFNMPWIMRLEPWEGYAGDTIQLVARNLTTDTMILYDGLDLRPSSLDVTTGQIDFVIPTDATGGSHAIQLRISGVNGYVYSNTVHFRALPRLDELSPREGVPGTPISLHGNSFMEEAQIRFAGTTYEPTFVTPTVIGFTLPDHENIATDAGEKEVEVINPDGRESNTLTFDLTLDMVVRVKAWRVFPDIWVGGGGGFGGPGPWRDNDDIQELFTNSPMPREVWIDHHIILQFEPEIGVAGVPADWAASWPREGVTHAENEEIIKAVDEDGNFLHFEEGAVNFYFVDDIDDWTTHAYTYCGTRNCAGIEPWRSEFVIFEDTPLLNDWEEAHVAAHELGHVFGLPHVCGDESDGTFGRVCNEETDANYLMYPTTSLITRIFENKGNTLTEEEARIARRVARLWHNL